MASRGRAGWSSAVSRRRQLADQQRARTGHRRIFRDAVGAGLGPMRRAERVHDVYVAQRRHLPGQRVVVLLLALVEAHVLEQHHLARRRRDAIDPVALQGHRDAEQVREPRRHRRQREFLREVPLVGAAEMGHHQHVRLRGHRRLDGGQRGADARIAAHRPVLDRHVQILANQHPFVSQIQARHLDDFHVRPPAGKATVNPPSTTPAWCPACDSRNPTRCRTRRTPSPSFPGLPW